MYNEKFAPGSHYARKAPFDRLKIDCEVNVPVWEVAAIQLPTHGTALNGNIMTNIPTTARRYSPITIFGGF